MHLSRTLLALLASTAAFGATAIAAPPAIGVPPIGVPAAHVPVLNPAPINVPRPRPAPQINADASAHADVRSSAIAGSVTHGTVTSVSGTAVTIALSSGTAQTYTVSPQTAARLQSYLDKTIAFRAQNGAFSLLGEGTPPLHGTLEALAGSSAQVKLANGSMRTYTVNAQQAAWLRSRVGKPIAFWTQSNGSMEVNESSGASGPARK